MNYAIVLRLLSYILLTEGALLLLPAAASLCYGEWFVMGVFLFTAALSAALGALLHRIKTKSQIFYMREGFATTALCWLLISVVGAVPFVLTGCIPNPVDALFETVSGFTTTGASILPGVEDLPKGILFWRSFTHWVGGMGVLVFLLSLLPLTGGSHVNLMKAESPGPQVDKLVPKVQSTAKILYGIYFGLTVIEFVFLLFGGMPVFESLLTAFGTAGTGGFGFRNDSFGSFSPYIQWVVTIFMILFGVNFNAYFLLLMRRFRRAAASEEVRAYFLIIAVAVGIITCNIYSMYNGLGEALRQAAFQVGSIITTTGFSSCDFDLWPTLSKEILVMLMFVGACAGSTGGGMKVSRILILGKTLKKELKQALHPQVVAPVRMDGKLLNHETIRATNVYVAAYIFIFAASFLLISLDGFDMVTNFTAIAATLNNIGPGLNQVGPMMNFGSYSNPAKLVMIFDMLAGRLEIFPMLVFFLPDTKKDCHPLSGSPFCMQQMQQCSERQIDFFLCAVLQGFQHGIFVEELLSGQVGDGAGHPEDAVMGAGREAQRVVRSAEQLLGTGGHPADPAHLSGRELGVAADALEAGGGVTPGLDLAGLQHLLAQRGTALGRGGGVKLIEGDGVHLDAEVDAVEQRAGHPAAVLPHRAG